MEHASRDSILDLARVAPVIVDVEEPVCRSIGVIPISGEGAGLCAKAAQSGDEMGIAITAIAYCATDAHGKRMFTPADMDKIGSLPVSVLQKLGPAVLKNCQIDGGDSAIEEAEGN